MAKSAHSAFVKKSPITWLVAAAAVILIVSVWVWWNSVYMSPRRIFWGMMANNLATESVTRHIKQEGNGQTLDQYIQLQFGALNASRSLIVAKQPEQNGKSEVTSETIGTTKNDYSQYIDIKTSQRNAQGKPVDTSKVVRIWGKTDKPKAGQQALTQYFQQSVLGIVPFANLTSSERQKLLQLLQEKNVYDISRQQPKTNKLHGRAVYIYTVSINPKAYIEMLLAFTKALGIDIPNLDPSAYESSQPLKAKFTIDKLSRQLRKVSYSEGGQEEEFSAHGLEQPIALPTKTIPIGELQNRVRQSLE